MGFLAFIGVVTILYFLARLVLWTVLDSDIELFIRDKLGKPISSLRGKVVWITGSSSGIGKHLALVLAKQGVRLVLSARNVSELEKVKQQCVAEAWGLLSHNDVLIIPMDLMNIKSHQQCLNLILSHFKTLDVLVNNAGRSQRAVWNEIDLAVDRELFELDVFAVVNLSRLVLNYFINNSVRGHLAVTSSSAGLIGAPMSGSYTGAKHALHGYFECLRNEMINKLDITLFCPGPTFSNFLQEAHTGQVGQKYGQTVQPEDKRMTGERCGYLYAVALANKTHLSWVGVFPINLIMYIGCYYPNVKKLLQMLIGTRTLQRVRDSR